MRWIKWSQPRMMHDKVCHPGIYYLMTKEGVKGLQNNKKEKCLIADTKDFVHSIFNGTQDLSGKKICFVRTGGWGDVISQSPIWRWIKKRFPDCTIGLACSPGYAKTFYSQPEISSEHLHDTPISEHIALQYDYIVHFARSVESSIDPEFHIVDIMAKCAGIDLADDEKEITYTPVKASAKRVDKELFGRRGAFKNDRSKIKIGIQWRASAPQRTFPETKMTQVVISLAALPNTVLYIFGGPRDCSWNFPKEYHTYNLCGKLSLEDSLAAIAHMDLLIAPDSSLLHAANTLGVKSVGIFGGPVPSKVRRFLPMNGNGPRSASIDAEYSCAPCFLHGHKLCYQASKEGLTYAPCFNSISSQHVFDTAMKVLNIDYRNHKTLQKWHVGLRRMGVDPPQPKSNVPMTRERR